MAEKLLEKYVRKTGWKSIFQGVWETVHREAVSSEALYHVNHHPMCACVCVCAYVVGNRGSCWTLEKLPELWLLGHRAEVCAAGARPWRTMHSAGACQKCTGNLEGNPLPPIMSL